MSERCEPGGRGSRPVIANERTNSESPPEKGNCPVSSRYMITPSDQISVRSSTSLLLLSCSGDMYEGEPTISCVPVRLCSCRIFEIPKSSTFTMREPSVHRARKRFSGFRSRCTTPAACASARPVHACSK
jgi:hypothetical protein